MDIQPRSEQEIMNACYDPVTGSLRMGTKRTRFTKYYGDFASDSESAGTGVVISALTIPAAATILSLNMNVRQAFVSADTVTLQMGSYDDLTNVVGALNVKSAGCQSNSPSTFFSTSAATTVYISCTTTTSAVSSLSSGWVDFYVTYIL